MNDGNGPVPLRYVTVAVTFYSVLLLSHEGKQDVVIVTVCQRRLGGKKGSQYTTS